MSGRNARLCLNMIVKNEVAILGRCLASVLPFIDRYEICDTGSTDGTQELIRDFFARHGVPGAIHSIAFHDFAQARNQALDLCRSSEAAFDYLLFTDADMELVVEAPEFRTALRAPAYLVQQRGGFDYYNVRLLRRDAFARYVGATHEYLDVDGVRERLEVMHFVDHANGSNRPLKTVRDITLLKRELELDPDNSRAMFYLAQSYKDAGLHAEAATWYEKVLAAPGWDEQLWYSRLMLAHCRKALGDEGTFVRLCLEAYDERPWRAEPLYVLARHYREAGRNEACLLMCEAGERIPYPTQDSLFVDSWAYGGGFTEETSIAGYYSHDLERRRRGRETCLSLATDRSIRDSARATARRNLVYYTPDAAEMFPGFATRALATSPWPGTLAMNPSIAREEGHTAAIVRCVNYTIAGGVYTVHGAGNAIRTRNLFVTLDEGFETVSSIELVDRVTSPPRLDAPVLGFEDCRLFRWRRRWWASCTVRDRNPEWRCEIALIAWEDDGAVTEMRLLGEIEPGRHEKNWMPLLRDDELYFVYSADPTRILRYDAASGSLAEHRTSTPVAALDHLRGGSQAVAIRGGWLLLTHETLVHAPSRVYLHRWVYLDAELRLHAVSDPFFFVARGIEFCAGLVHDPERSLLVTSFGVNDGAAQLGFFIEEAVFAKLRPLERDRL